MARPIRPMPPRRPYPSAVLEGIDVAGTVARLGVPVESLYRMLRRLAVDGATTVAELRAAVDRADYPVAARHAHSLAGAGGNLGATRLRDAAKTLELAANAGDARVPALTLDVEREAATVFRSIASLETPASSAPAAAARVGDVAAVRQALALVRTALGDGDPVAAEAALADLDGVGPPAHWRGELSRLRQLADGYAFDEATDIAARLAQQLEDLR